MKELVHNRGAAIQIIEGTKNDLLKRKAELVSQSGDAGRIAFFIQQHLPKLFAAYQDNAQSVKLDHIVAMDERDGLDQVINRGPLGMAKFLEHFRNSFGIDVRRLLSATAPDSSTQEEARS